MMTHPSETELNDYVDDVLEAPAYDGVHTHVLGCADCAAQVRALRELIGGAAAMPKSIEPPAELWPELRAVTIDARASRAAALRSLRFPLAAAALVLIALASALTWYVTRATSPTRVVVTETATPVQHPTLVALRKADSDHQEVSRTLMQVLEQRRAQMDPAVVATVEQNLRIMNVAIANAKAALASDPANQDVAAILTETYESKVNMLRRAVRVTSAI